MSAVAEIRCLDGQGQLRALVIVGEQGIEQVRGDMELAREVFRTLAADPELTAQAR